MMNDSDVFLGLLAILFPPFIVWYKCGIISADFIINICLCLLGGIPGIAHAWYIIYILSRDYNDPSMRNTEHGPRHTHHERPYTQHSVPHNSTSRRQDNGTQNCRSQACKNKKLSYGSTNIKHAPRTPNYDRSAAPPPYVHPSSTSNRP
ncbi:hypothetical protein GcM1_05775 [Golovinomyces cichoracearum]|uniref:Stress response rci peptide n=1 Tax=Golovinomyces cichoracearum TaxID=62708 RepID=A0A420J459_9PEZI|nr:hypothetical protein GcM1_05775 [Golovinomyces cichoracearum]